MIPLIVLPSLSCCRISLTCFRWLRHVDWEFFSSGGWQKTAEKASFAFHRNSSAVYVGWIFPLDPYYPHYFWLDFIPNLCLGVDHFALGIDSFNEHIHDLAFTLEHSPFHQEKNTNPFWLHFVFWKRNTTLLDGASFFSKDFRPVLFLEPETQPPPARPLHNSCIASHLSWLRWVLRWLHQRCNDGPRRPWVTLHEAGNFEGKQRNMGSVKFR